MAWMFKLVHQAFQLWQLQLKCTQNHGEYDIEKEQYPDEPRRPDSEAIHRKPFIEIRKADIAF